MIQKKKKIILLIGGILFACLLITVLTIKSEARLVQTVSEDRFDFAPLLELKTKAINKTMTSDKQKELDVQMISISDANVTNVDTNQVETIEAGEVVFVDAHSINDDNVVVEYNDSLYYIQDENFCVVIGDDSELSKISEQIKEDYKTQQEENKRNAEFARIAQGNSEYPVASYVWQFLRNQGYSEYVTAGIIGNMMVECGGYTLDLQPYIWGGYGNSMYGLCQWYDIYNGEVINSSIDFQLEYLMKTIEPEFVTFGRLSGFTYQEFCQLTDVRVIAEAFAATYERCGSGSYYLRKDCAEKALAYFMGS